MQSRACTACKETMWMHCEFVLGVQARGETGETDLAIKEVGGAVGVEAL